MDYLSKRDKDSVSKLLEDYGNSTYLQWWSWKPSVWIVVEIYRAMIVPGPIKTKLKAILRKAFYDVYEIEYSDNGSPYGENYITESGEYEIGRASCRERV